jgi:LysM repeat protein
VSGKSFCVEAVKEPAPTTQKTSATPVPSSSKAITPTSKPTSSPSPTQSTPSTLVTTSSTPTSGNGVATPSPIRSGMVNNCKTFHFVEDGDNCGTMAEKYGISNADVIAWNGLNSGCTNLWQKTYACVGIIGGSTSPSPTSSAQPGNGVPTPAPVQPRIVKNCNKFYFVEPEETCDVINQKTGARVADIIEWNGLNSGCSNIWGSTYACVGVIGGSTSPTSSPSPSPIQTGNGVSTPAPVQPRIVKNCNKFYFVEPEETCDVINQKTGARVADIITWNGLNSGCSNIWGSTYACVGVIGQSPTTPTPTPTQSPTPTRSPSGPTTPSPIQSGMTQGCTLWHFIGGTTTCQQVLDYQKITLAQFYKWNPAVKADCSGLWKDTHACVRGP